MTAIRASIPAEHIPRFNVLGVSVSGMTMGDAVTAILDAVARRHKGYVCVTGVHGVTEAQNDDAFRVILNASFLTTTDGMPLVWLGKHFVGRHVERVYGPDLMAAVFEATRSGAVRHFLYGGAPGVVETLQHRLEERFPGVSVVGSYTPPFRPLDTNERHAFVQRIRELRPDIIWVGLSTPKQERFMAEYLPALDTAVMVGVGAAFDFHAGRVRQAPRWVQRSGFEWLYRLCAEPRRLARRYLVNNPLFVWRISAQLLAIRKYTT